MGEKDCELCQSYGCKVFGAYVLLCLVAIIAYFIMVPALTIDGKEPDKAVLIVGLLAWTAAMIVPVTAFYAIVDWRLQQQELNKSAIAKKFLDKYLELKFYNEIFGKYQQDTFILYDSPKNLLVSKENVYRGLVDSFESFQEKFYELFSMSKVYLQFLNVSDEVKAKLNDSFYEISVQLRDIKYAFQGFEFELGASQDLREQSKNIITSLGYYNREIEVIFKCNIQFEHEMFSILQLKIKPIPEE